MNAPERILVRSPTWVGDAVMATPALRALRATHSEAEITVEGRPVLGELLAGLPSYDRFLDDPGSAARGLISRVRRLQRGRYDWAVLLPDSPRAALGPYLAGIPKRVGYARDVARRMLLTEALRHEPGAGPVPMTERYLRITRQLGCPDQGDALELAVAPTARERCAARLAALGVARGEDVVAVTPGASFGASKLWPPEYFAHTCDALATRLGLRTVVAPGPGEVAIAHRIANRMHASGVAWVDPGPRLDEVVALVERASLVLTNDTGPRHVAVALDRPAVVLMGPTDPRITDQHTERQRVLREDVECSPCQLKACPTDHRCMTRLTPERAVAAAEELLRTR
ncbi:MAG: lipopolysaccharide heptosyltransferase II [Deltaproteobacteria bacterium]|nr:lipopolysaccharide heptosyltransferase II [Deltaproteobacteria bacterium]